MKQLLFLLVCLYGTFVLQAQPITLKGKVKSKLTGEPVSSASVQVKGRAIGTIADEKGDFSLKVGALPASLLISSVNFEDQEIMVSSADALTVVLNPSMNMAEVIVEG